MSNYEIVLVNDGSTDGTKEFIDGYTRSKHNVVVYHQDNQGASAARNKGIKLATGNLICFLDSDDTYEPTFLEKMKKRQQKTNVDVVHCGHNKVVKMAMWKDKIRISKNTGGYLHFLVKMDIFIFHAFWLKNYS